MSTLNTVLNIGKISVAAVGLILAFYTTIDIMLFISDPDYFQRFSKQDNSKYVWSWALLNNMFLMSVFIMQHSLFAMPQVKKIFADYKLQDLQRSIYIILTCIVLQLMTKNWITTNALMFWNWDMNKPIIYYSYYAVHGLAWTLIYIGSICLDINELLGIKQIYYSIINVPAPINCKSHELQRLYNHMRHPSFLAFLTIFWICPALSLDRFLLACILSSYMYLAWKTDNNDYEYQRNQFERKFNERPY